MHSCCCLTWFYAFGLGLGLAAFVLVLSLNILVLVLVLVLTFWFVFPSLAAAAWSTVQPAANRSVNETSNLACLTINSARNKTTALHDINV